jgi:hypothetical protein
MFSGRSFTRTRVIETPTAWSGRFGRCRTSQEKEDDEQNDDCGDTDDDHHSQTSVSSLLGDRKAVPG